MNLPSKIGAAICAVLVMWLPAAAAEAHSVYIFAYPDNSQICTSSYFSARNKVRGGLVRMSAASGELLAEAQTDEQGQACFPPPESGQDLVFTVEAGDGHRAEFKLSASDIESAKASESGRESIGLGEAAGAASDIYAGGLTSDDLRQALSPIMRKLAEMESEQKSRVNLKDIIGGLGWLIGLAGAGLWAAGRKTQPEHKEKP